jgi:membrane-associated protease RseP (regulator of RpoE activity)
VNSNRAAAAASGRGGTTLGTPATDPGLRGNLGADAGVFNDPARIGSGTLDAIGAGTLPNAANPSAGLAIPRAGNTADILGFNLGTAAGPLVVDTVVPAGVASVAGLLPGDRILSIDGRALATPQDWTTFLAGAQPGTWNFLVQRGGEQVTIALPVGAGLQAFGQSALGVRVNNSPAGGVAITDVRPGSPAAAAGLRPGDRLLSVAGNEVRTPEDVARTVDAHRVGQQIPLRILRGIQIVDLGTTLAEHQRLFGQPDSVRQAMRPGDQPSPVSGTVNGSAQPGQVNPNVPGPEEEVLQEALGPSPEAVEHAEEQLGRRVDESRDGAAAPASPR